MVELVAMERLELALIECIPACCVYIYVTITTVYTVYDEVCAYILYMHIHEGHLGVHEYNHTN